MSDDPEGPVHYQISVTGRQAAAFFLVLLAALGLSFFFGMKTGQAAHRGPDAATRLAAMSDLPVPTAPPSAGDEGKRPPAPPEAVEKKLGFEDAAPKEVETPVPTPAAEPKPAAAPPAAASAAAAPKKDAPRKEAAKKETGPYFVQILATKEPEAADQMAKKLKAAGGFVKPDVSTVPGKGGLFRVRIGPYPERTGAETAVRRLKAEKWNVEPTIVRADKP